MKRFLVLLLLLPSVILAQDSWLNIEFDFDGYADEVSWNLYSGTDSVPIASGGDYINGQETAFHQIELDSGDYTFELLDAWGDGLGYPPNNLGWCLISNDCQEDLFYAEGNYGDGVTQTFNLEPCATPDPPVIGCMDETALNYDETADVNDEFSCEYPDCEGWGEPFVTQECAGGAALLYYNWESSDNPNCNVIQITYGSDNSTNAYNFDVNIDNGIWGVWAGNGQMPPNWEEEFYLIATFADSTLSDTILYTPYPCTQGCTDSDADNYNPWANIDDGSCGNQSCDTGFTPLKIEVTLDNWPSETGWSFVSGDGSIEVPSGEYSYQDVGQTYTYNVCAMEGGFEFIISDTYGDGMGGSTTGGTLDGEIIITGCDGDTITTLSDGSWVNANQENVGVGFGSVAYSGWRTVPVCNTTTEILGCMDPLYEEFNPLANTDDYSCTNLHSFGCTDSAAFNYDSLATQMEIIPNCDYELWIGDAGADGWGNSFLGVVQGDNQWSFTMGPGQYEQTFPIWLETDKPVEIYYFEVGGAQTPPEEVAFQTLHNSFKLTDQNGVILIYEGWNPFADNGQGALQPFEAPLFTKYTALPYCGNYCIPSVYGCIDPTAFNYSEDANTDDGTCIPVIEGCTNDLAFNYNEDANTDDGSCVSVIVGCTDEEAFNYNEDANVDDPDSCIPVIEGCMDDTQFNYNQAANTDDGSCEPFIYGCTDPTATNYDETANTDNFSCIPFIYGCTDPSAFNYNVLANTDDGTCIPVVLGCTDTLAINTDTLANVNFGCVYPIFGCIDPTAFNYNVLANTDDGTCIPVILGCTDTLAINTDTLANTNFGCIYPVYGCIDPTMFNYDINSNTDDGSCIPFIYGCMDATMFNYNSEANTDNGNCIPYIYGCMDSTAFNYNPLANTDNGSCILIIEGCTNPIAINYDSDANTDDGSCINPVYGCTDPEAFNYNELANVDNDTCISIVLGCTNSEALNYDSSANTDDGSCILPIYGCMDDTMFNYNPLANVDNGTCIEFVYGCNDATAFNYDPLANTSDNSCCFIDGCTDSSALNYDVNACYDDGSCIEIITGCADPNAYNFDPTVNLPDNATCLYDAGCYGGPGIPYWLNDPCYAWVIDIDSYCCTDSWDSSCQDMYNYCEEGWPTSLDESGTNSILIFPNPSKDLFNIETRLDIEVEVYDLNGRRILKEKSKRISLAGYPSGMYNMIIIYDKMRWNKRVIKQ